MKVKMRQDKRGSPDGIKIIDYKKGKTYDMPDVLAKPWIKQSLAIAVKLPKIEEEEIEEPKVEEPEETKVIEPPETKEKNRGEK